MKKLLLHETHALEQFKLVIRSVKKALYKPIHALLFFIALAPQVLMAQAPTFSSSPVLSIGESQTYRYLIEASDPNSDPITLSATQIPSWLNLSTELASTTFAGKQNAQNSLDGQGTSAEFNFPSRMAMDAAGNNYILEHLTQVIRKVSPAGLVTTVGQFPGTNGITVGADNNIYATSGFNINRITPAGAISTFAGSSSSGFVDATSTAASFENPQAITSDASGNIYVMDNFRLRKITITGIVTTLAGSGTSGYINATGAVAKFEHSNNGFFALTVDASGNIYVGEDGRIRKVTPTGDVSLFSGSGEKITTGYTDGTKLIATYTLIDALTMDADGNLLAINSARIRKVTQDGTASTLIGSTNGYADGEGAAAQFSFGGYGGLTVDSEGSIFVVEFANGLLRKLGKTLSGNPAGQAGTHPVVLNANDGNGGSTDQSFTITVNDAPVVANAIQNQTLNDNAPFSLDASATFSDPNAGTVLVYAATVTNGGGLPTWLSFDPLTVTFSGTPTTADIGTVGIVLTATDNFAMAVTENFNVSVIATNFAPSFTAIAITDAAEGVTYNYEVKTADSNNEPVTVTATTKPSWLTLTTETNVSTLAGSTDGSADGTGTAAQFSNPNHIAIDAAGNTYVADGNNHQIRKISATGVVSTYAGTTQGFSNGLGTAQFDFPVGIAVDAAGNVYVGDRNNHKIRKITPGGVVSTFAGSVSGSNDGQGIVAQFNSPLGLAFDGSGNLYVADGGNNKIRKISPSGLVSTFAGSGTVGSLDGTGVAAEFFNPSDVAIDHQGNIYVTDWLLHRIRKITSGAVVTTFAGPQTGLISGYTDAVGTSARFSAPYALDVDAIGNVYVAERGNHKIRKITPAGVVSTFAGLISGSQGFVDGTSTSAKFDSPGGLAIDGEGNLYVADQFNHKIRKIITTTTLSGDPTGNPGTHSVVLHASDGKGGSVDQSFTITVNNAPTLENLISDQSTNEDAAFSFTFAANTFSDVNAGAVITYSSLLQGGANLPSWLSFDGATRTFSGTPSNSAVSRISLEVIATDNFSGTVSDIFDLTIVNTNDAPTFTSAAPTSVRVNKSYSYPIGTNDVDGDIATVTAPTLPSWLALVPANTVSSIGSIGPTGIDIDGSGNLIMIDRFAQTIVKLTPEGISSILAGKTGGGTTNGTVSEALFTNPTDLTIDATGNIYVAESNHRIRKITPAGDVTTFAGSITPGASDGSGASASFNSPQGLATDAAGNVYVSDGGNHSIRKITPQGVVTTFAGSSTAGFINDTGVLAQFNSPRGLEVDAAGNVYVADYNNHVIRKITIDGIVTTFAGSAQGFADGLSTVAQFNGPSGVDLDIYGHVYVADYNNFRVRKISTQGVVSTIAGSSTQDCSDGVGTAATLVFPEKLVVDTNGTLYVSDPGCGVLRKISPATITGDPLGQIGSHSVVLNANDGNGGTVDQTFTIEVLDIAKVVNPIPDQVATQDAAFSFAFNANTFIGTNTVDALTYTATLADDSALPSWLSFDDATRTFTGTPANVNVGTIEVKVTATDPSLSTASDNFIIMVTNVNDAPTFTSTPTTIIAEAITYEYAFVTDDIDGDVLTVTAPTLPSWLMLKSDVAVSTFAGSTSAGRVDATGTAAEFDAPTGATIDANGHLFISDANNNIIRKITSAGVVSTYVASSDENTGQPGIFADLRNPNGLAFDSNGNLYVVNTDNNEVLKITPDGQSSILPDADLGGGDPGDPCPPWICGGGDPTGGEFLNLNRPTGIAIDASDNIYIADAGNFKIWKVTSAGVVSTFAGSTPGNTDGTGTAASFGSPTAIAVDASGTLYVTDAATHSIRMITSGGVVTTIAGSSQGFADGTGTAAQFNRPTGITIDANGDLLISDTGNHRIRKITTAGVVTTVAGSTFGYAEGNGTSAQFNSPTGIVTDAGGNIYIADNMNNTIRKIENTYSISGTTPSVAGAHSVVLTANDGNGGSVDQSFTICVSNMIWTGATDTNWATATNWTGGSAPMSSADVILAKGTNDPVIMANVEVSTLDVKTGGVLTVMSNSLKVNNGTVLNGSMTVTSGASFIPMGNITGTGAATINRNTTFGSTDGKYSVIGSPITMGSTSSLGNIIYSYDETVAYDPTGAAGSTRFVPVTTPETMLVGDAYFSANTGSISFNGIPNTGNIDVSLVYDAARDGGPTDAGFNLVSNPYTAAVSYTSLVAVTDNPDIDGTIYLWDDGGSNIAGAATNNDYITVSGLGQSGGNSRSASWDGFIRSTQGFFVKATTAGTVTFKPAMMELANNSDGGYFRKADPVVMRFSLSSALGYNDILIGFVEGATLGMDRALDAQKIKGNSIIQFYSRMEESVLANQALPFSEEQVIVDLGFDVNEAATYTFQIEDLAAYTSDILLIDNLLNQSISISETGSYTFETDAVVNSDRFSLVFNPDKVLAMEGLVIENNLTVFSDENTVNAKVDHELKNASISIHNLSGALITQINNVTIIDGKWSMSFPQQGVFIMTIQSDDAIFIKKFLK